MVMKVITVTTTAVAVTLAARSEVPQASNTRARSSLKAASPMMPFSIPIEVMPTWTEDKNWVGLSSSFNAACAPLSPDSDIAVRRALRLEARASSDMAKTPLSKVRNAMSRKSMDQKGQ